MDQGQDQPTSKNQAKFDNYINDLEKIENELEFEISKTEVDFSQKNINVSEDPTQETSELLFKLRSKRSEVDLIKNEIGQLKEQYLECKYDNLKIERETEIIQLEIDKLTRERDEYKGKLEDQEKILTGVRQTHKGYFDELSKHKNEFHESINQSKRWEVEQQEKETEIESYKKQIETTKIEVKRAAQDCLEAQNHIALLTKQIDETKKLLNAEAKEAKLAKEKLSKLNEQVYAKESRLEALEDELRKISEQTELFRIQNGEVEKNIKELNQNITSINDEIKLCHTKLSELEVFRKSLDKDIESLRRTFLNSEAEVTKLYSDNKSLKSNLVELEKDIFSLKTLPDMQFDVEAETDNTRLLEYLYRDLENVRDYVTFRQRAIERISGRDSEFNDIARYLENEVKNINGILESIKQDSLIANELEEEVSHVLVSLANCVATMEKKSSYIKYSNALVAISLNEKIKNISTQVSRIDKLKKNIKGLKTTNDSLVDEDEKKRIDLKAAEENLEQTEKEWGQLKRQHDDVLRKIDYVDKRVATIKEETLEKRKELSDLKERATRERNLLLKKLCQLEEVTGDDKKYLNFLERKIKESSKELDLMKTRESSLRDKNNQLQPHLNKKQDKLETLRSEINSLSKNIQADEHKMTKIERELVNTDKHIESVRGEIQELMLQEKELKEKNYDIKRTIILGRRKLEKERQALESTKSRNKALETSYDRKKEVSRKVSARVDELTREISFAHTFTNNTTRREKKAWNKLQSEIEKFDITRDAYIKLFDRITVNEGEIDKILDGYNLFKAKLDQFTAKEKQKDLTIVQFVDGLHSKFFNLDVALHNFDKDDRKKKISFLTPLKSELERVLSMFDLQESTISAKLDIQKNKDGMHLDIIFVNLDKYYSYEQFETNFKPKFRVVSKSARKASIDMKFVLGTTDDGRIKDVRVAFDKKLINRKRPEATVSH
jgi:chromosome segregation ATPase